MEKKFCFTIAFIKNSETIRAFIFSTFILFFFCFNKPLSAQNDSLKLNRNPWNWNIGIGFNKSGYYIDAKDEPSIYNFTVAFSPYFGYFVTNNLEVGLRAEQRIQRTSFENQSNGNG